MRASLPLLLSGVAAFALAGCAADDASDPATGDSDFTSERPEIPADLPVFTDADAPFEYGAKVRVSFGGGEFRDVHGSPSRALSPDVRHAWNVGVGASPAGRTVFVRFGVQGTERFELGTYSCADGDAVVFEAEWNPDGTAKPRRHASACSVVIDRIEAGPSATYARTYGRFEAKAAGPDGLTSDVRGTFLADFPVFP